MGSRREPVRPFLSSELEEIVARGYREFLLPAPQSLGVCTDCCMNPQAARNMLASPVAEITLDMLTEWYGAAFAADRRPSVLLWVLPRMLDFLARGVEVSYYGNEVAFRRCEQTAKAPDWPGGRYQWFQDFACAYVDARLDEEHPEFDATFCMFDNSGMDIAPVLDRLDQASPVRLARAILADWQYRPPQIGRNPFWKDNATHPQIQAWFARPELAERLMSWGVEHDGEDSDTVLQAADILWSARAT